MAEKCERFVKFLVLRNYLSEDLMSRSQGSMYGVLKHGLKSLDAKVALPWPSEISAITSLSSSISLPGTEHMDISGDCSDDDFQSTSSIGIRGKKRKYEN
ncbi:hypothetical protein DAPPUDRAFT_246303 [Daphnia pulex]|uniref:Uncharacterized protein n=1 Tax=Daphnia pulex TaxID=6669 RepID=E9GQ15_DAPPU|nr:hypothetical protein DAPPUDRAFT_246303 [Daphnia pulex]|eukprot:EFX78482.1 hypothetical protein DAPPUDRAFT_246303 [Daphnia pulex]